MFNKETYTVYVPKEQIGDSPYSTESPRNQMTTRTSPITAQKAVVGAVAYMAVQRVAQGAKTEMEATARHLGTAKRLNSATKVLQMGVAYVAGGVPALVTMVTASFIMDTVEGFQLVKRQERYEQDKEFERMLKGAKATFGMGGSAYD